MVAFTAHHCPCCQERYECIDLTQCENPERLVCLACQVLQVKLRGGGPNYGPWR